MILLPTTLKNAGYRIILVLILASAIVGLYFFVTNERDGYPLVNTFESTDGYAFRYSNQWEVENTVNGPQVFWKALRYYSHIAPDTDGRTQYSFLSFQLQNAPLEKWVSNSPQEQRTTLRCPGKEVVKIDQEPYSTRYYYQLPSGRATITIWSSLPAMEANNIISHKERWAYQQQLEPIVCSFGFLSDQRTKELTEEEQRQLYPKTSPPEDLTPITNEIGWAGLGSTVVGFKLYAPPEWELEFSENAPAYHYTLKTRHQVSEGLPDASVIVSIFPQDKTFGVEDVPYDTGSIAQSGKIGDTPVTIYAQERTTNGEGPGELPGTHTYLSAITRLSNRSNIVTIRFSSSGSSKESYFQEFKDILAAMEFSDAPERPVMWTTYDNDKYQYHLNYPANFSLEDNGFEAYPTFKGPGGNAGSYSTILWIARRRVPVDSNVHDLTKQLFDAHKLLVQSNLEKTPSTDFTSNELHESAVLVPDSGYTIDGLPVVHYRITGTDNLYAADEFFVIAYNQMFIIEFVDVDGKEDWNLNSAILDSLRFDLK